MLASLVIAFVAMGIGDSLLRPALRRMAAGAGGAVGSGADGDADTGADLGIVDGDVTAPSLAQSWSVLGTLLLLLAIAFMARALYASS